MPGLNLVQIIGNCSKEPEMRFTPNGTPITTFNVTVDSYFGTGENRKKHTEEFNIVTWSKLAELCNQFLNKGNLVYIQGRLQTRSWETQQGEKKYRTEIFAQQVLFLTKQWKEGKEIVPEEL